MVNIHKVIASTLGAYSIEEIQRSVKISGTPANLVHRALKIEARAEAYAKRNGYVGVGVISIQQFQLDKWLRRTGVEIYS